MSEDFDVKQRTENIYQRWRFKNKNCMEINKDDEYIEIILKPEQMDWLRNFLERLAKEIRLKTFYLTPLVPKTV